MKTINTNSLKTEVPEIPKFASENEAADWWASRAGRAFVTQRSAEARSNGTVVHGSPLISKSNRKSSVQIAIRLPEADLAQARKLAEKKGLGYQTFLKMLVHEGLRREARRVRVKADLKGLNLDMGRIENNLESLTETSIVLCVRFLAAI